MSDKEISFTVNGTACVGRPRAGLSVLGYVRDILGLTGAKTGCQTGDCGACTMIVDGAAVQTCQMHLSSAKGAKITTVEGLMEERLGAKITQTLIFEGAAQCGYCLPGIVASATAAFASDGKDTDIAAALSRNICRCGTHHRILRALNTVRDDLAEDAP